MTLKSQPKNHPGPAPTANETLIEVRLQPDALARIDTYIASQPDPQPSRPEALRRLAELGLPRTTDVSTSDEEHTWGGAAVMTA
jgi:hypothetical protein